MDKLDNLAAVIIAAIGIYSHLVHILKYNNGFRHMKILSVIALMLGGSAQALHVCGVKISNGWYEASFFLLVAVLAFNGIANPVTRSDR